MSYLLWWEFTFKLAKPKLTKHKLTKAKRLPKKLKVIAMIEMMKDL